MNSREAFEAFIGANFPTEQCRPIEDYTEAFKVSWAAWQASRKQLLKELSESEPVRYLDTYYGDISVVNRVGWEPLIIRPTEEE